MNFHTVPSMRVGGTVRVSRFVKLSTSADRTLVECSVAGERAVGVSQAGQYDPPGFPGSTDGVAATADKQMAAYGPGFNDVLVEVGSGGLTPGVEVATDNQGRAVAAAAGNYVLGQSLETAAAGSFVRMWLCWPYQKNPA